MSLYIRKKQILYSKTNDGFSWIQSPASDMENVKANSIFSDKLLFPRTHGFDATFIHSLGATAPSMGWRIIASFEGVFVLWKVSLLIASHRSRMRR